MGPKTYPDVMTTLFCVAWLAHKLGYFPHSERDLISRSAQVPASASVVDAQPWMIPRTVNRSCRLHIWVSLHRKYRHRFSTTVGRGNDKPRIPRAVVLFVRMRSLSRPWASLLTEAFLITTVAVSSAMAGKTFNLWHWCASWCQTGVLGEVNCLWVFI